MNVKQLVWHFYSIQKEHKIHMCIFANILKLSRGLKLLIVFALKFLEYVDRIPYFAYKLKTFFSYFMQI